MTRAVVLVPRRADGGHRDRVWSWLNGEVSRWGLPIVEGHDEGSGPFSRSLALNRAAAEAGAWDVALLLDADTHVNPDQAARAIARAEDSRAMVVAFDVYRSLNRAGTERVLGGFNGSWAPLAPGEPQTGSGILGPVSSVVAVPRQLWDAVGGFDERFKGWGFEDRAFAIACDTLGGFRRQHGTVWHLWHVRTPRNEEGPEWPASSALVGRYRRARGNPAAIRALIAERHQ
jgi:hypothetical protein